MERIRAIDQTTDWGYILGGSILPDDRGRGSDEPTNAWLAKTNAEGDKKWELVLNESRRDSVNAIRQTRDGGYIAVGSTDSLANGREVWLLKLMPNQSRIDGLISTFKVLYWVIPGGFLLLLLVWRAWKKP